MSDFQKPNKKPFNSQPLREFPMVGGDDDFGSTSQFGLDDFHVSPEEEEELKQARRDKLNPPISKQSKTRLEYLSDIGSMTKDITIGGVVFTLRTLKSKEQRQVYLTIVDVNKVDEIYNLKLHTLAHSLIKIDHQDIGLMIKVTSFSEKLKMLENLEELLTDQLYLAYVELKTSSDKQFALITDQDVKEVSEELKKL